MAINAGFMGIAKLGSDYLRFENANVSAKQELITKDLAMGDWDIDSYAYGPISLGGTISGPMDEAFSSGILTWAASRSSPCGSLTSRVADIYYFCGGASETGGFSHAQFSSMLANNISISATAGDIVQWNMELIGSGLPTFDNANSPSLTTARKLLTWEKLNLTISGGAVTFAAGALFQSFNIQISNNVTMVYSLGQSNLYPAQLIVGPRKISGSITVYNISGTGAPIRYDDYAAATTSTLTWLGNATKVQFHRPDPTASAGPITSTINFTGVTHQSGGIWGS